MKSPKSITLLSATLASLLTFASVGCSKLPEMTPAKAPSTTIGTEIDDSVVTASVKSALLTDSEVKSIDFKVETRKGEVQLSGFVDNQSQIDRATAITQGISGVKSVQNKVSLKGAPASAGNTIDDSIVTSKVKSALLSESGIKSQDIAVVTRKGEVQLSGFVNDQTQIDRAMQIARGIEGASSVSNEMSIKK